jgi:hypothetical protein
MLLRDTRPGRRTSTLAVCIAACSIVFFAAMPLRAITYDVVTVDWTGGHSLTGTIETDGTLGALTSSNILDVNLVVSGPYPYTFDTLTGLSMAAVSATATQLSTTGYFAFEHYFSGAPCDPGNSCDAWVMWEDFGPTVEYRIRDLSIADTLTSEYLTPVGGPVVIGTAIPEPATLPLVLLGALFLAGRRRVDA